MVVFDATFLVPLLTPSLKSPPIDPATDKPVTSYKERLEGLVSDLTDSKTKIIIPTPSFSEVLIKAEQAASQWLAIIRETSAFQIQSFDDRCAIEAAIMTRDAIEKLGDKRAGSLKPWQQVKFDRQIIAIAKVNGASAIYSDDRDLGTFARGVGLTAIRIWQLPLPQRIAQTTMFEDK